MDKSPLETGRQMVMTETAEQELIVWSSSPTYKTTCDLLESIVLDSRDEAMAVDPAEEAKQKARVTEAHAMAKMYKVFRDRIDGLTEDRKARMKTKANRQLIQDDAFIESIILANASGSK